LIPLNLDGSYHECPNKVQTRWEYEQHLNSISDELNDRDDISRSSVSSSPSQPPFYKTFKRSEFTNRSYEDILNQIITIEEKIQSIQSKIVEVLRYFRESSEWEDRKSKWK
jgi:GTP1/Obg family GTP-binding protein